MIIYEADKTYVTRDDKPNENWTGEEGVLIVEDGSELSIKIITNCPYYDFVLDAERNLIDITPTERPAETPPPKSELELLQKKYDALQVELQGTQSAVDFLLLSQMPQI